MSLPVKFRRIAHAEFIEAAAWYEAQRPGLGAEFVAAMEQCLAQVAEQPELYAVAHNGVRRAITRRFPYSMYFRLESQRIVVLAVFHSSRNPMAWQNRN